GHRFVRQVETHDPRLLVAEDVLCRSPDLGFDAPTAYRSESGAVIAHEHFGRLKAGNRPADLHNGSQCGLASIRPQPLDFVENVNFHKLLSLTYLLTLLALVP